MYRIHLYLEADLRHQPKEAGRVGAQTWGLDFREHTDISYEEGYLGRWSMDMYSILSVLYCFPTANLQ